MTEEEYIDAVCLCLIKSMRFSSVAQLIAFAKDLPAAVRAQLQAEEWRWTVVIDYHVPYWLERVAGRHGIDSGLTGAFPWKLSIEVQRKEGVVLARIGTDSHFRPLGRDGCRIC